MDCFCFVILHYQTQNDTIECVNSILNNISYPNYQIIVVDNGSPNKSGALLDSIYKGNSKIDVIINDRNAGFTDGNNIGFLYAKLHFDPEYIALINNDTVIQQTDFIEAIIRKNTITPFDILGPDIITLSGKHQNPAFNKTDTLRAVENYISFYRKILFLNYLALDYFLERVKKFFIPKSNIHIEDINALTDYFSEQKGVMLHGSAVIFSKSYIEKYDGLYPGPFMYGEEAILDFIAKRDNLTTLYSPEIKILHKDDSSTNFMYKKALKKRRFYLKNFLQSLIILQELMKEDLSNDSK
jgi:GT2 family glycosyltransferase